MLPYYSQPARRLCVILVLLLISPLGTGFAAGENPSPEDALFRVSRFRHLDRSFLAGYGELIHFDADSVLIRTTQKKAELLAEVGAEITRVMDPPGISPPVIRLRFLRQAGVEEPIIREIIGLIDRDDVYRVMGDLTGENSVLIGGVARRILTRNSYQTEGIAWATQYAYERLEDLGLAVEYHDYSWSGNNWRNVVAEQPGTVSPENIYIICGHIDSLPAGPRSPGADDNASGSTAVLITAKILSRYSLEHTVRYLLFTGEEQGLLGSDYYVRDCLSAGDIIRGALNFDMIAYDGDGDGAMDVHSGTTEQSNTLGDLFLDTVGVYGLNLAPVHYQTAPSWSDQYRFWRAGYPALVAIESADDFNPNYHQVTDVLADCDLDYMTEIVKTAAGTLARLAVPVPVWSSVGGGDYDGDGTSEIAVFRSSSGLWAARGVTRFYFGRRGDLPVPGDWRGDGTTLPAVFRPAPGLWAVRSLSRFYFGRAEDRPVAGAYGPGATWSPGVFRPESGLWAIRGLTRFYFGRGGDLPVPADYAGDGIWNFGVSRPASGLWAIRGLTRFYFGSGSGSPIPADYDGVRPARAAVFQDGGCWIIRGLTRFDFGTVGDFPVPSGYRGGRISLPAIFHPASGLWVIRGLSRAYFGTAGDQPVSR